MIAKLKNDVSLNVIAAYMQLLLSIEQKKIAENKLRLTNEQRKLTQKSVDAGALPELNVAQLITQLAAVARSSMYPTLSAYGNVGTNYSTSFIDPRTGHRYNYIRQLDINLSQSVGLSLNIPILSGKQGRTAYRTALQTIRLQKIQQSESNRQLEQAIYTAYNNAVSGMQKYEANVKAESYARYAYELASKRYNIGMLSTADYLTALNKLADAQTNKAIARAESVFRVKVLEWYGK